MLSLKINIIVSIRRIKKMYLKKISTPVTILLVDFFSFLLLQKSNYYYYYRISFNFKKKNNKKIREKVRKETLKKIHLCLFDWLNLFSNLQINYKTKLQLFFRDITKLNISINYI